MFQDTPNILYIQRKNSETDKHPPPYGGHSSNEPSATMHQWKGYIPKQKIPKEHSSSQRIDNPITN